MAALSQSQEDYLEAILGIGRAGEVVCVHDIARRLDVSMPSVTGALKRLERLGLIRHGRYDYVELTAAGRRRARDVAGRHALLKRFLRGVLRLPERTAERDACAIEHHASPETIKALVAFLGAHHGRGRRRMGGEGG